MSRAAKGADCKSAGVRLRRFESYFPHQRVASNTGRERRGRGYSPTHVPRARRGRGHGEIQPRLLRPRDRRGDLRHHARRRSLLRRPIAPGRVRRLHRQVGLRTATTSGSPSASASAVASSCATTWPSTSITSSDTPLQLRKASMGIHRNEGGAPSPQVPTNPAPEARASAARGVRLPLRDQPRTRPFLSMRSRPRRVLRTRAATRDLRAKVSAPTSCRRAVRHRS